MTYNMNKASEMCNPTRYHNPANTENKLETLFDIPDTMLEDDAIDETSKVSADEKPNAKDFSDHKVNGLEPDGAVDVEIGRENMSEEKEEGDAGAGKGEDNVLEGEGMVETDTLSLNSHFREPNLSLAALIPLSMFPFMGHNASFISLNASTTILGYLGAPTHALAATLYSSAAHADASLVPWHSSLFVPRMSSMETYGSLPNIAHLLL